ncbi:hypothetical protein FPOAC2_09635 [Fusarium poae]|jgi:hypothetical protein|uniref:hypothetical protein n=1 Tax=Fusarium poae TaxID=36050 RepID=UPI001CE98915|nr:hypothetical protein FPOAC1_009693 [Fusarium poae]KAG8670285.1 hypothetical protein FPOAC1_009693 [Fusarium poae]
MTYTTFHPFVRLPIELRIMIWDEACLEPCRRYRQGHRAIHYMTVHEGSVHPLNHDSNGSKLKNKSVYLWHAGMWMACRESQRVIASRDMNLVRPEEEDTAALVLSFKLGAEQWRQIVPSEDLFCICRSNKKLVDPDWSCLVDECLETPPKNVAFEFEQSWTVALASRPQDLFIWNNPRAPFELAFLSKLIFDWVLEGSVISIHLIDKDAKWVSRKSGLKSTSFDLDEQFIDIPLSDADAYLVTGSAVLEFLTLQEKMHSRLRQQSRQPTDFDLRNVLSIIISWDSRVEC